MIRSLTTRLNNGGLTKYLIARYFNYIAHFFSEYRLYNTKKTYRIKKIILQNLRPRYLEIFTNYINSLSIKLFV